MKRILFVLLAATVLSSGCGLMVSDFNTVNAVEKQGYSDVHVLHIHPFFASFFRPFNHRPCPALLVLRYSLLAAHSSLIPP